MKKVASALVLSVIFLVTIPAMASGRGHENDDHWTASATEMGGLGLLAASVIVGGVYLVRRRNGAK